MASNDNHKLRIVRLLQVREQSKEIAKKLRRRADDEKRKQLASVAASKLRQFDANKKKCIANLQAKQNAFFVDIGESHNATADAQLLAEEWKVQKGLNETLAKLRGTHARHRLNDKNASERLSNKMVKFKSHPSIKKRYNENAECETECSNLANKALKEIPGRFKNCEDNLVTSTVSNSQLPSTENFKISGNYTYFDQKPNKYTASNENNDRSRYKILKNNNNNSMESGQVNLPNSALNIEPLNTVSQFIKKRNETCAFTAQNDKCSLQKDPNEIIDLESVKDVIQQSKHLNSGQNILSEESEGSIDSLKNKYNPNKFCRLQQNKRHSKFPRKNRLTLNKSHVKIYKTELQKNLKNPTVSWQVGKKDLDENEKFVQSYDHINKFSKKISVNNRKFVEKLPKSESNAFQQAQREIKKNKQHKIQQECHCMDQEYKKKAVNKVIAENENRNLMKSLELISASINKNVGLNMSRSCADGFKTKDILESTSSSKTVKSESAKRMSKNSLNVATWSLFQNEDQKYQEFEKESENSSKSILVDANENSGIGGGSSINGIIQMIECQKETLKRELKKVKKINGINKISNDTNTKSDDIPKFSETSSDCLEEEKIKSNRSNSNKSLSSEKVNMIRGSENLTSKITSENISESSKSSYSFQGVRIVIEVQKDKNKSKSIIIKDQMIQTSKNTSESSIADFGKRSNSSIEKNLTDPNSFVKSSKSDITESTTFMDLPDKITTGFDLQQKKNLSTADITTRKDVQKLLDRSDLKEPIAADKGLVDLKLRQYIMKLLNMSKTDVDKIEIDVSDMTTPSSSTVKMPSNNYETDKIHREKINKAKNFIKENHKLLDKMNDQLRPKQKTKKSQIKPQDSIIGEQNKVKSKEPIDRPCRIKIKIDEEPSKTGDSQMKKNKKCNIVPTNNAANCQIDDAIDSIESQHSHHNAPLSISPKNGNDINYSFILMDNIEIKKENCPSYDPLLGGMTEPNDSTIDPGIYSNLIIPNNILLPLSDSATQINNIKTDFPTTGFHLIPHELSTIIEVDTPRTLKNTSILSNNNETLRSHEIIQKQKLSESKEGTNTPTLTINEFEYSDPNFKSFVSFREYLSRFNLADQDHTTSSESLTSIFLNNMASKIFEDSNVFQSVEDDHQPFEGLAASQSISNNSINEVPDFKRWLKNNGLNWAIPTLKKTQEASALSSTSSSSVNSVKIKNSSNFSIGLSTLSDNLNLSDEKFLENIANEKFSKRSIRKELESLFKKEIKSAQSDIHASKSDKTIEKEDCSTNSKDKSQHRTSTPVQLVKSEQDSSKEALSQHISNALFGIDSDLSSVKNISNSDKNCHSDERDTLSVPNATLKFNRLFNSSEKSEK